MSHCTFHPHFVELHTMCKITYYVWNKIIQGSLSHSVWKKFLSLEKFYTQIVADVADYYEVCQVSFPNPLASQSQAGTLSIKT